MHTRFPLLTLVLSIVVVLTADTVYPNGRTTPKSTGIAPIKATCIDRSKGERHDIFRARITGIQDSQKINVVIDGVREELALPDIKRLTLPTAQVNGEGFMKGTVVRQGGTEQMEALAQVKSGSSKVRMAGFKSDGTAISIDLSKCKEVEFASAAAAGDSAERPAPKTAD
jgi:hypothetical protein